MSDPRVAGALAAAAAAAAMPWGSIRDGYRERRAEREFLAPIFAEARRDRLTFPQVVVTYPAYAGKPVYWDVTVASSSTSYAEGRPAWPIVWTNPDRVKARLSSSQERVLARVAAVRDDVVYLDYLGRP
ncbi:MAG: hypothetical protein HY403_10320 [Elusimicrobia bacterium]|nr:hypothetical protein [Elusimicrobiota bacterium]